jgi:hypothetical protein
MATDQYGNRKQDPAAHTDIRSDEGTGVPIALKEDLETVQL